MRVAADRLGVSVATVCYHVAYIRRLPETFVEWLETGEADKYGAILLERRLRKIVQLQGADQIQAINEILFRCRQQSGGDSPADGLLLVEQELVG